MPTNAGSEARLSFVCHGARVQVCSDDADILRAIAGRLPPRSRKGRSPVADVLYRVEPPAAGGAGGAGPAGGYRLYRDGSLESTTPGLLGLLEAFESSVDFQVAVAARRRLFVHAGVVAWGGRAVVIPGRSFSGKSSLVMALVQAGAEYLSDEYAIFDRDGLVYSWPRPLALRYPTGIRRAYVEASTLNARPPPERLPVGVVVVARYEAGARWRPRHLSAAEGVLALLDNTVMAQARPRAALGTLRRGVLDALVLEGRRGEAAAAATSLVRRLEAIGRQRSA